VELTGDSSPEGSDIYGKKISAGVLKKVDAKANVVFDCNKAPKGDCANGFLKKGSIPLAFSTVIVFLV
jgi:hypothetical protein